MTNHVPIAVTALLDPLSGGVSIPGGTIHLDALLAWAVSQRDGLPPALDSDMILPIEIPVAREAGGRFHLASAGTLDSESYWTRPTRRSFPVAIATVRSTMGRLRADAGPTRGFVIPREVTVPRGGMVRWWCMGDPEGIEKLLSLVTSLGKKRSVGLGRVASWQVLPCEPWGDGFPVVTPEGRPTRHLPIGWPGLVEPSARIGRLTYPYWSRRDVEVVACP